MCVFVCACVCSRARKFVCTCVHMCVCYRAKCHFDGQNLNSYSKFCYYRETFGYTSIEVADAKFFTIFLGIDGYSKFFFRFQWHVSKVGLDDYTSFYQVRPIGAASPPIYWILSHISIWPKYIALLSKLYIIKNTFIL